MCSSTKHKIAAALRRLMLERTFQKITVQNLMDASGMKRQSFYYHFQDTRDVLVWICQQELIRPLEESLLEFEDWLLFGMELLAKDRAFYRRVLAAGETERILEEFERLLSPRLSCLFYKQHELERLESDQRFVVSFAAGAVIAYGRNFVLSRKELDIPAARGHLRCLLDTMGLEPAGFGS